MLLVWRRSEWILPAPVCVWVCVKEPETQIRSFCLAFVVGSPIKFNVGHCIVYAHMHRIYAKSQTLATPRLVWLVFFYRRECDTRICRCHFSGSPFISLWTFNLVFVVLFFFPCAQPPPQHRIGICVNQQMPRKRHKLMNILLAVLEQRSYSRGWWTISRDCLEESRNDKIALVDWVFEADCTLKSRKQLCVYTDGFLSIVLIYGQRCCHCAAFDFTPSVSIVCGYEPITFEWWT